MENGDPMENVICLNIAALVIVVPITMILIFLVS